MKQVQNWRRLDGTRIRRPIEDEVRDVLDRETKAGHDLKVCIGTDSQVKAGKAEFATVILFVRPGKGGFMYISNEVLRYRMTIKDRMMLEVSKSIEIAFALSPIFTAYNTHMEIHADINTDPNFKSNDALKEATGYILGMGFAFKAKPHAFASSSCANRIVQ